MIFSLEVLLKMFFNLQTQTMRLRSRRLRRRDKWPLQVGLFLIYVLVQLVTSASTNVSTVAPVANPGATVTQATQEPQSTPIGVPTTVKDKAEGQKEVVLNTKTAQVPPKQMKENPPLEEKHDKEKDNKKEGTPTMVYITIITFKYNFKQDTKSLPNNKKNNNFIKNCCLKV